MTLVAVLATLSINSIHQPINDARGLWGRLVMLAVVERYVRDLPENGGLRLVRANDNLFVAGHVGGASADVPRRRFVVKLEVHVEHRFVHIRRPIGWKVNT